MLRAWGLRRPRGGRNVSGMDKDAQNQSAVPTEQMDPDIVPAPLPDPAAVDDGDEEDGRV